MQSSSSPPCCGWWGESPRMSEAASAAQPNQLFHVSDQCNGQQDGEQGRANSHLDQSCHALLPVVGSRNHLPVAEAGLENPERAINDQTEAGQKHENNHYYLDDGDNHQVLL